MKKGGEPGQAAWEVSVNEERGSLSVFVVWFD
jgi:hypothetical protein